MKPDAGTARKILLAGATGLPCGIVLTVTGHPGASAVVTIIALALLIAGLHTYGRAGPDPGG
jgi:hypothetical protein